jgi:tRNA-2-methylthio-N6-dimethylallyladenosine synthase
VSEDIRLHRLQRLIDLQRQITLEKFQDKIGTEIEVYVEALSRKSNEQVSGKLMIIKFGSFGRCCTDW